MDKSQINEFMGKAIDEVSKTQPKLINDIYMKIKDKSVLNDYVRNYARREGLTEEETEELLNAVEQYLWGYYILVDLIKDENISDIKIMSWDNIRVKRLGKRENSEIKFKNKEDYERFVRSIALKNQKNLSFNDAIQYFTDAKSSEDFILRFNITTEYINSSETPVVHIRKIPKHKKTFEDLKRDSFLNDEVKEYLKNAVRNNKGILFAGAGGSGKTTLMNVLLEEISHDKSILCIQEAEELFCETHPEATFQHVVINNGEGKIVYTLRDLATNGLLTDQNYFIIGEIKGAEASAFTQATYTGHSAWASVHSNSAKEAISKVVDYAKLESTFSEEKLTEMIASGIKIIIFMKDYKVSEIVEVIGWDRINKILEYKEIYNFYKF